MLKWVCVALGIIFSLSSFAEEVFFRDQKGDNYLISYQQNDNWILEHILIEKDKLQEVIDRQVFTTKSELKMFEERRYGRYLNKKAKPDRSKYLSTEINIKVWEVKEQWNLDWEVRFADWVKAEFNKDFFVKYNLETDCADVAFALRWIFARNNGLPAANTMAGSQVIFSQDSMKSEWVKLPRHTEWHKDQVFLAALKYIMRQAYTGTLNIDGYPIELKPDTFLVGTIHLDGGHTMIISEIDYQSTDRAPIWKLSSTVPAAVRELNSEMMLNSTMTPEESGGLFRMRWPVKVKGKWGLVAKEQMPFYSKEQYTDEFLGEDNHFTLALIKRLGIPFHPKSIVGQAANTTLDYLKSRVSIVETGYQFCLVNDCEEGTANYEEHSTPTRDKRLYSKFLEVDEIVQNLSSFDESLPQFWSDFKSKNRFTVLGVSKTLADYEKLFKYGFPSSHPEDRLEERWGINPIAIRSSLEKKILRSITKRQELIEKGKICEGTSVLCDRGTKNWELYNTYEFDLGMRKGVFEPYLKFCEVIGDCLSFEGTGYFMDLKGIPFYNSEPSGSRSSKWGRQESQYKYAILPEGEEVLQLTQDFFSIDGRIFDVNKKSFLEWDTQGALNKAFFVSAKLFVAVFESKIETYDFSTNSILVTNLTETISDVFWFNEKYFVAQTCQSSEFEENCRLRYYYISSENRLAEIRSEGIKNTLNFYSDSRVKLIDKNSNSVLSRYDYNYEKEEYQFKFEYYYQDEFNQLEMSSQNSLMIGAESAQYFMLIDGEQYSLFDKKTKLQCPFKMDLNGKGVDFIEKELFFVSSFSNESNESPEYVIYEIKENCHVVELVKFSSWPELHKFSNYLILVDQESNMYYKYADSKLQSFNFPDSYSWAQFKDGLILWIKYNQSGVISAYSEDINTAHTIPRNHYYLPVQCNDMEGAGCVGVLGQRLFEIYATWDADISRMYGVLKNSLGEIILSSLLKRGQDEVTHERILSIREGLLVDIGEQRYLYLKP